MGCACSKSPPHSPTMERSASATSQSARRKSDESQDRFSAEVVGSSPLVALPQEGGASNCQQLDRSTSSQRSDNPLVPPQRQQPLSPPCEDNDTQQPLASPLGGSQQSPPSFSQQKEPFWVPLGEKKRSSTVTPQLPTPPLKHSLFRHQGAKTQRFYHRHARSDSICSCGSRSSGPITAPPPTYQKRLLPVPIAATTQRPHRKSPSSVENSASLSGLVASAHPFSSQPITVVDEATENTTNSDSHNSGLVDPARNLPHHPLPWLINFESLTYSQSTLGAPFQSASLSDRDRMLSLSVGPAQAANNGGAAGNQDPTLSAKALCAFSSNSCSRVTTALPSLTVTSEERSFLSMTITSAGGVAEEGSNTSSMNINSTSSLTPRRTSSSSSPRGLNSSSVHTVKTDDSNNSLSIFSAAAAPSSSAVTTLSALISSADEKGIALQQHSW